MIHVGTYACACMCITVLCKKWKCISFCFADVLTSQIDKDGDYFVDAADQHGRVVPTRSLDVWSGHAPALLGCYLAS